jgi:hypothetical protein
MKIPVRLRRFLLVLAGAFLIIALAHLLRGRGVSYASSQAGIWSLITATVFTIADIYKARKGQQCAVCEPESK